MFTHQSKEHSHQSTKFAQRMDKRLLFAFARVFRLTMRGLSQAISLQIEFGGIILDPQGNTRMGLSMAGKVNRNDYGITFSRLSETGEKLLGETVSIIGSAEFLEG
ncbi:YceI-like domain-containing protein [Chitinophaga sancti]|nr:YceI-like domain-containing protein [Chitinophaga sancti]